MDTSLKVSLRGAAGALVRVLGLVERRGFVPISLTAISGGEGRGIDLYLTVRGDRPLEQLVRQVAKSWDVVGLEVLQ
jgi:acetolactate synthase II small subunit